MAPSAIKVKAAVNAMEKLGIHPSTTRPVLYKLLKKSSNRWKPIEENNYQFLADSIFEMQEAKAKRDAANGSAIVLLSESRKGGGGGRGRGRGRRRTEVAGSSNSASEAAAVEVLHQLVPVVEDEVPIAVLFPAEPFTAAASVEQASDVGCSKGDVCTKESSVLRTKVVQYGRRRTRKEMVSLASCINGRISGCVNAGGESSNNTKSAPLTKKDAKIDVAHGRKVNPKDVADGNEMLPIAVARGVKNNIPYFKYISDNEIYKDAHVKISLAQVGDDSCCQGCYGGCTNPSSLCACGQKTGGETAYESEGILRKDFLDSCISRKLHREGHLYFCERCPMERVKNEINQGACKGHLRRKFIKECWKRCDCKAYCGNRTVQRKIYPNLEVFYSARKGWGVRTLEELSRGQFVCEYVGEVLTNKEHYERAASANDNERQIYILDADWASKNSLKDEEALCLDATLYGNVARFINHRCYDANLVDIPVEIETPERHYYHVAFFTTRIILQHEELNWILKAFQTSLVKVIIDGDSFSEYLEGTLLYQKDVVFKSIYEQDYGIDSDDQSLPTKAFRCYCKSTYCRDRSTCSRS